MRKPIFLEPQESFDPNLILDGNIPAVIFKNFYSFSDCKKLVSKITNFSDLLPKHTIHYIGPFLMNYVTKKEQYFVNSEIAIRKFDDIFSGLLNPIKLIQKKIKSLFFNYRYSNAMENGKNYSPGIIRIHTKGTRIPLHKDQVTFEGINYNISTINAQLSCILHLQESEKGGQLKIYNKSWAKKDERFRDPEFGYKSKVTRGVKFFLIEPQAGDLVLINPSNFHEVTPIQGKSNRISLGMFVGLKNKSSQIFTWA